MAETTTPVAETTQSYKDWNTAKTATIAALGKWNDKKNELSTLEADYSARINLYNTGITLSCPQHTLTSHLPSQFNIHGNTGLNCDSNVNNLRKEIQIYKDNYAAIGLIQPKLDGLRIEVPTLKKDYDDALEAERIAYDAYLADKSSNLSPEDVSAYNSAANQGEIAKAKSQQMLYWGIGILAVTLLFVGGYFLFKYLKVKPVIPVA